MFRARGHYAGIGIFSVRIDDRDFVDAVLEGSPADRAGLKVGDEIVSVDGAPYHPIRSFRGKVGQEAAVAIRRSAMARSRSVRVDVVRIAPLHLFNEATLASARVIERDGRRIGYVHVWASVGDITRRSRPRSPSSNVGSGRPARASARSVTPVDALIIDMRGKIGGTGTTEPAIST